MDVTTACSIVSSETGTVGLGKVNVLVGEEVYHQLEEEGFCSGWDSLYDACPWGTVFQSRAFVSAWYSLYRGRKLPVLVKAERDGRLVGLLTLTKAEERPMLIGAGGWDAEYQTWLATALDSDAFIKDALLKVQSRFPEHIVSLRYIPGNTPLGWVRSEAWWQVRSVFKDYRRPLMEITEEYFSKELKKKNRREKVNRLKRMGDLSFERITDRDVFMAVLDELIFQSDFRKAVMYNKTPFRDNSLTKKLIIELFEQGLIHASVLKLTDQVIASNVSMVSGSCLHLQGLNSHSPCYAKYSPGILSFLMLGKLLADEGYSVFDLTPGGDTYKEGLANYHDQVYELRVGSRGYRFRKHLREGVLSWLKDRIRVAGAEPRELKLRWYRTRGRLRLLSQQGFWGLVRGLLQERAPERVYRLEGLLAMAGVQVCGLSELLCFDERGGLQTRWDFLGEAERRLQVGERCFGLVKDGVLLCCAWLGSGEQVLTGLYCHRSGLGLLAGFLGGVRDRSGEASCVAVSDPGLQRALEGAGLRAV